MEIHKNIFKISDLKNEIGLKKLSIGMSNDYKLAVKYGASHVRIGSAIFGKKLNYFKKSVFIYGR